MEDEIILNRAAITNQCYAAFTEGKAPEKAAARHELANFLIREHNFLTIHGRYDEVYYYTEGIYVLGGEAIILNEVESIIDENCTTTIVNEVLNKIKRMTKITRDELNNVDKRYLCLNNGIFDLETNKFMEHSPDFRFLYKIKTDYKKDAKCPNILKVLNELLPEETLTDVQELSGYCLLRSNSFKKVFVIEGPGDAGKTTYLNLLTDLIGINNIATSSLQYLCDNKNGTSTLYGKMANFYDDLDVEAVRNTGMLKMISGDGYIPAEKKYMDQFTFKNEATICFTCNNIPKATNPDITYYKRFIILLFHNSIPEHKIDRDLNTKLLPELSGFLNWCIEGLQKLRAQNKFSYSWNAEQVKEYMQASCSSVAKFIQEELEECEGEWITRASMYSLYVDYCQRHGIIGEEQQSASMLSRNFLRYCAYARGSGKKTTKTKIERVWVNVRKKEVVEDFNIKDDEFDNN